MMNRFSNLLIAFAVIGLLAVPSAEAAKSVAAKRQHRLITDKTNKTVENRARMARQHIFDSLVSCQGLVHIVAKAFRTNTVRARLGTELGNTKALIDEMVPDSARDDAQQNAIDLALRNPDNPAAVPIQNISESELNYDVGDVTLLFLDDYLRTLQRQPSALTPEQKQQAKARAFRTAFTLAFGKDASDAFPDQAQDRPHAVYEALARTCP